MDLKRLIFFSGQETNQTPSSNYKRSEEERYFLNNLTEKDYTTFTNPNGRKMAVLKPRSPFRKIIDAISEEAYSIRETAILFFNKIRKISRL